MTQRSSGGPVALAALVALAGCGGAVAVPETPAHIVHATPESREAVARAVEQALSHTHVTIDPDALTHDSNLVVEQGQIREPRPLVLDNRDPGDPGHEQRFRLVKIGDHCMLVYQRTNRHFDLIGTDCEPL